MRKKAQTAWGRGSTPHGEMPDIKLKPGEMDKINHLHPESPEGLHEDEALPRRSALTMARIACGLAPSIASSWRNADPSH